MESERGGGGEGNTGPDALLGAPEAGRTVDRQVTPEGLEIALVQRGALWEVVLDGQFLMASDCRRSEQSLAELTLAPLAQRNDITALVAGLGMGHTLRAVLDLPGVVRVDVVEFSQAVIDWNRRYFSALPGNRDALADPRVRLHHAELLGLLKRHRQGHLEEEPALPPVKDGWLALLLDVDNGSNWLSRPDNHAIYSDEGLGRLEAGLRPGGILGVWSAARDVEFYRRLHARFVNVAEMAVPVEVRGRSSLDYVYRARRGADRAAGSSKNIAQA